MEAPIFGIDLSLDCLLFFRYRLLMNLQDLLENSGVEKQAPPYPKGRLPRRFLFPPIRWVLNILVLPFVWLDSFAQYVAKLFVPPPFVRAGKCKKRGNCCHYILIRKFRFPFSF